MRITAGQFKGRKLVAPEGQTTRPTSDRAREAIFNILNHAAWATPLARARVMDVFAGSGALGLEALSHGAAFCLFVEIDFAARGAIRDNCEALGVMGATRIHRRDATQLGLRPGGDDECFDLVFMDPPYSKGLGEQAIASLKAGNWLSKDAIIVYERAASEGNFNTDVCEIIHTKTYGVAEVLFLKIK